jgi:hypothetical protein
MVVRKMVVSSFFEYGRDISHNMLISFDDDRVRAGWNYGIHQP